MRNQCVRGAITVDSNTTESILAATEEMLREIIDNNSINASDVCAMIFTATQDLDKVYPAKAARNIGFTNISLMCMQEMVVKDSLSMCIRVMIMWNTNKNLNEIKHIYLRGAKILRPDIVKGN